MHGRWLISIHAAKRLTERSKLGRDFTLPQAIAWLAQASLAAVRVGEIQGRRHAIGCRRGTTLYRAAGKERLRLIVDEHADPPRLITVMSVRDVGRRRDGRRNVELWGCT